MVPLSIFILYLGHQQWRRQRSFTKISHIDIFTYHTLIIELIWVLGGFCYYYGAHIAVIDLTTAGYSISSMAFYGQVLFHTLTCVERYLAVVHPVIYLGLRNARGVKIRNISIGCVWMICILSIIVTFWSFPDLPFIQIFSLLVLALVVVSFCSLAVLRVLIRPGPGEESKDKMLAKQRAFITIAVITAVLWLWFAGFLIAIVIYKSGLLSYEAGCLLMASVGWLNLPFSLVLPLLYLYRAGKLRCCCINK